MKLYHGSDQKFNTFSLDNLGKNGKEQGAGVYLSPNRELAEMYSENKAHIDKGYLYTVQLQLDRALSLEKRTVSEKELSEIVDYLETNSTDFLSNYGDVDYSGYEDIKVEAIELLNDNENDIDLFNDLVNTSGDNTTVVNAFDDVGNYTHAVAQNQTRLDDEVCIVFDPNRINIEECEEVHPESNKLKRDKKKQAIQQYSKQQFERD